MLNALPDAVLHIKDFHRAKIENGRKVWELFGDEAHYLKDKREAVIKRPRFIYYDKKDEAAETSAEAAHIFLNEKDLERLELQGRGPGRYEGLRTDFGIGQLCARQGANHVTEPNSGRWRRHFNRGCEHGSGIGG